MRRAAVLGSPIAHSLSPVLHRSAYAATGLDWEYDAIECSADRLPRVLESLDPIYVGLSLTMPLKLAVLPFLDSIVGEAAVSGAVNTVVLGEQRVGHNTDVAGIGDALTELGIAAAPEHAVLLGAGGTARAAVVALGAAGIASLSIVARRHEAASDLRVVAERAGVQVVVHPWQKIEDQIPLADLVVSTTPAGATDELARRPWPARAALLDVLYEPWPTALAEAAQRSGAAVVGGLSVLVGQAAAAFTLMSGLPAPYAQMRIAGEQALAHRASGRG